MTIASERPIHPRIGIVGGAFWIRVIASAMTTWRLQRIVVCIRYHMADDINRLTLSHDIRYDAIISPIRKFFVPLKYAMFIS